MLTIHEQSDDAILAGWAYFREWRVSRNALLLFDALERLNIAERAWITEKGRRATLRREWQVLRRCVMAGLGRLRAPLLAARSPSDTERALFAGGKRATLARANQLDTIELVTALFGTSLEQGAATLEAWGKSRSIGYLKKRRSELGLTPRKASAPGKSKSKRQNRVTASGALRIREISPGRRQYRAK